MKNLNRSVYAIIGVIVLLLAGMIYAWSIISKSIAAAFPEWTTAQLSVTFTIIMSMFCIGCMIAGILAKMLKPRWFLIISAVLLFLGFMLASTTTTLPVLYLGFGVLCGLGAGLCYNVVMSTMSAWFPDKQGQISGVMLMGFGLSSFIIGKIYTAVTPFDGGDTWRTTFRILGIIIFIVLFLCSFFFDKPDADFVPPVTVKKKVTNQPALDINSGEMVKKPTFWLYYIWAILISASGLALISQAGGIARQVGVGVSDGNIATVVGVISIFNGIGRIIFGTLFDKKGYKLSMILNMVIFIVAGLVLTLALCTGQFILLILGFVVGGFAYGGVTPTNSAIISDFFGRTNYPMNFSLINTNLIIASFASTISGKLYDVSQSYMSTIFMMIGLIIVGFVVYIGIRRPQVK